MDQGELSFSSNFKPQIQSTSKSVTNNEKLQDISVKFRMIRND